MFHSCLRPIKAIKIISYGTQDSQHPIRTAATKWRQLWLDNLHLCLPSMQTACIFALHGAQNLRFSTFNQNSSEKEVITYDLSCLLSMLTADLFFMAYGTREFNQNSSNKETTSYDLPISIHVRCLCKLLGNCKFALRGSDSFSMHVMWNDPCTVPVPTQSTLSATARLR